MALEGSQSESQIWFPQGMDLPFEHMPNLAGADLERLTAEVNGEADPRTLEDSGVSRRTILKMMAAAAGYTLFRSAPAYADAPATLNTGTGGPDYDPKSVFHITISAVGGMDHIYTPYGWNVASNIQQGQLKGVPSNLFPGAFNFPVTPGATPTDHFLNMYAKEMLLIRQHQLTNGHQQGELEAAVGSTTDMRMPDNMAILAAQDMPGSALAYVTGGGITTFPAEVIAPSDLSNLDSFKALADPNELDPKNPNLNSKALADKSLADVYVRRKNEFDKQRSNKQLLPKVRARAGERFTAQGIRDKMNQFLNIIGTVQTKYKNNQMVAGGVIAMNLFQLGQTRAAKFEMGGYDTHGDPAGAQTIQRNLILYQNIHLLKLEAAAMGIPLCITVESDFGRINMGSGTGLSAHHEVGHTMIIHPYINGPRLVGVTDANKKLAGTNNATDTKYYEKDIAGTKDAKLAGHDLTLTTVSTQDAVRKALKAA
ncbi:MAG: hypothetical protein NTZ25_02720 [Candidatus Peregrinibacteria bacterium]|nr:hypothetical protein [Candidatus Peregrinibacteria bacterium]